MTELLSVTPNIDVDTDLSKSENIGKAKTECVEKILIQKTSNENFYREIITGKLISVFIITYQYHQKYVISRMVGKYTNSCKSCVFVEKWVDITTYRDYSKNIDIKIYLKDVSSTDVEKYIDERKAEYKGFATFKDYLDDVFARGEKYYADSLAKSEKRDAKEIEDKKKIKEILKNLK